MQADSTPTKIPVPFADAGTKNTIPIPSQVTITPGAASFTTGFPPLTFTPIAAGGVPPFGADFNGVLNAITQALRWSNAGGQYTYDADFATATGGYPKGALLQRSTLDGFWLNTGDNNETDPDAGGAGWVDPLSGQLINAIAFTSSGTYTPTAGTKKIRVRCWAAGGGTSGGISSSTASSGGGAGGYAEGIFPVPAGSTSVTVGAGGAATSGAPAGGNGGGSSFGALLSATGGNGGSSATPGSGGTGTGGYLQVTGGTARGYFQSGTANAPVGGMGGSAFGSGNAPIGTGLGSPGPFPGGGASGGNGANVGAAGGNGLILVEEFT